MRTYVVHIRERDISVSLQGQTVVAINGIPYGGGEIRFMDSRHVLVERNGKRIVLAIMRSSQGYDVLSRGIPMEVQVEASAAPSTNSSRRSNHISVGGEIRAPMPAQVKSIAVVQGDTVEEGQLLVVLETMKMENDVRADRPGTVGKVEVHPGLIVEKDQLLMTIE